MQQVYYGTYYVQRARPKEGEKSFSCDDGDGDGDGDDGGGGALTPLPGLRPQEEEVFHCF